MQLESMSISQIIADSQQGENFARSMAKGNSIEFVPVSKRTKEEQAVLDQSELDKFNKTEATLRTNAETLKSNQKATTGRVDVTATQQLVRAIDQSTLLSGILGIGAAG